MLYCCYVVKMKQYFDEIRMIVFIIDIGLLMKFPIAIYVCKDYILEIRQNQL